MAERALWLPKVLKDAGLKVAEVDGWRTRNITSVGLRPLNLVASPVLKAPNPGERVRKPTRPHPSNQTATGEPRCLS